MKLKKLGTAVAVTAALGAGTISQAHADAFAEAMINITNFLFTSGGSTPLVIGADITNLTFTDVLTNNAGLAGSGTSTSQAATNTFQASTDPAQACVGACTKPENTFVIDTPPLPGTSFSRADSLLANQPIVVPGFITGTQSATIAETWINSNTFGGATSDITNNSTFEFTAARNIGTLGFDFDAVSFLRAWTSAGSTLGTSASGDIKWEITLSGPNGIIADWSPQGSSVGLTVTEPCDLNANAVATFNTPQAATINCSGHFHATSTFALVAGQSYSLVIAQHVTTLAANATAVPEPATLALLGIGLAGIGFAQRRRSA